MKSISFLFSFITRPSNQIWETWTEKTIGLLVTIFSLILTKVLLGIDRFKGDSTMGGYSGPLRDLLIDIQVALRVEIAVTDAFPEPEDFERGMEELFASRAGHMVETERE